MHGPGAGGCGATELGTGGWGRSELGAGSGSLPSKERGSGEGAGRNEGQGVRVRWGRGGRGVGCVAVHLDTRSCKRSIKGGVHVRVRVRRTKSGYVGLILGRKPAKHKSIKPLSEIIK